MVTSTWDWKWIVEKVGLGIVQLVAILVVGMYLSNKIDALDRKIDTVKLELHQEIAMLKANDIEHLRTEMTININDLRNEMARGFDDLRKQNEALVYTLVKNKQLSESDAEYIKGVHQGSPSRASRTREIARDGLEAGAS
ncbi:MAG: hypothetical protein LBR38_08560 [Synergistaceae bacterium]|jgi:hypothetical protein|nr:hypothetical protein [Synergistaceae bacterium]